MLIPALINLPEIIKGGTWEIELLLFEDEAETKPFNLTGWTVSLELNGVATLLSGAGLTITPESGLILAALTATETLAIVGEEVKHVLKLVKGSEVIYPLHGEISAVFP